MEENERIQISDNHALMEIDPNEESLKNFKAIYYMLNASPDSITKVFTKPVNIEIVNIYELNDRIVTKIRNHFHEEIFSVSVHVGFQNKESKDFSSWSEFSNHKWYEPEKLTNIVITWDFLVKLPKYKNPQRHKLMVKMSSSIKPEEMLNLIISGNIEDMDEIEQGFFPIIARIDFIDRDLGDELINIVKNWIDGLTKNHRDEKGKTMLFLQKHKRKVALFTNYFFSYCLLFLGAYLLNVALGSCSVNTIGDISIQKFSIIFNTAFIFALVVFMSNWVSKQLARSIFTKLSDYGDVHIFNITKGDENEQKRLEVEDGKNKRGIVARTVFNTAMNILCGIFVTLLFYVL